MGYIPSPVDRNHLKGLKQFLPLKALASLPSSYDLRTLGRITPVRDQGDCGSCWSFGAMASLESGLLTGETRDFSENNLKNNHGYDWGPCDGGNIFLSTAYLMRWSGPVNETDDPYHDYDDTTTAPTGLTVQKHAQNIIHLPPRTSSTDNDAIKNALITYGALTVSYYHSNAYYNATNQTYYYNGSNNSNHEVAIVGWDDNFDKNLFSPVAPGNGAFIIKNSWGTSWGDNGYFYISYYDHSLGYSDLAVFTSPQSTTNYVRMYSYDPLGILGNMGYGTTTAWFSNIFTAQGNDKIASVSFYNSSLNSPYEIYVYKNLTNAADPRSGTLAVPVQTGTLADPGYLTIPLSTPVNVTSGQSFSVVIKLTTPGLTHPIPVEYAISGYSSGASASSGQSYISSNGTSWTDITNVNATMNVCIKAYAANVKTVSEIIWRNTITGENITWTMDGTTLTATSYLPTVGVTDWDIAGIGDLNNDANRDIVWRNSATGEDVVWFMSGFTLFSTGILPQVAPPWTIAGVGDFNGDGKPDIICRNPTSGENTIWFMTGLSLTATGFLPTVPSPWSIGAVVDFNHDGKPDIVWRNSITGENVVWYMDGALLTATASLPTAVGSTIIIAGVGDFNDDTNLDIFFRDVSTGANSIWFLDASRNIAGSAMLPTVPATWKVGGIK